MKRIKKNITTNFHEESFIKKISKKFSRTTVMTITITVVLLGIFTKAYTLQVTNYDYYAQSATSSAHKVSEQQAPRGEILDSNGEVLATSKMTYALTFDSSSYKFETEDGEYEKLFNETMIEVFDRLKSIEKIRNDNNANLIDDDFELKIDPDFRFEFNAVDEKGKAQKEFTFKNDIGLTDYYAKKLYKKNYSDLSDEDADQEEKKFKKEVDKKVSKASAEETFNYLLDLYKIPEEYDLETKRNLVIIRTKLRFQSFSGNKTVNIVTDLSDDAKFTFDQLAKGTIITEDKFNVDELSKKFVGLSVTSTPKRVYPNGSLAAPVIGYLSKVSDKSYEDLGYNLSTDYIGVAGIEGAFEDYLKGSKGANVFEVNKTGEKKGDIAEITAYPGDTVKLSLNSKLQKVAEESLKQTLEETRKGTDTKNATRGGVIVLGAKTGKILALASYPTYDPNDFVTSSGLSQEKYNEYYGTDYEKYGKDKGWSQEKIDTMFPKDSNGNRVDFYDYVAKPMVNYATQSLIPPGSTFKLFTSYALQAQGHSTSETVVNGSSFQVIENGVVEFKTDFPGEGDGKKVNMMKAIEVSSNPYFMQMGKNMYEEAEANPQILGNLGITSPFDIISKYAWDFGLGSNPSDKNAYKGTGIEIEESVGNVANFETLKKQMQLGTLDTLMKAFKAGEYQVFQYSTNTGKNEKIGTNTFKNFDIYYKDGDSTELYNAKKALKDYISEGVEKWKSLIKLDDNSKAKVKSLVENIIKNDKENYKGITFTDDDYYEILKSIEYEVNNFGGYTLHAKYNIYNVSIGQGDTNITPLQLASSFATMFNGGTRLKTTLLDEISDAEGNLVYKQTPEVISTTEINENYINNIKIGMKNMANNATNKHYFKDLSEITGGKTGSATFRNDQTDFGRNAFAWMMNVYPLDDPEIVVVSVMFDGHWGKYSIPINAAVTKAYDEIRSENND